MKKNSFLFLFLILTIPLFASGHMPDIVGPVLEIIAGTFIYGLLFIVLTILTGINMKFPQKIRSIVYAVILSIFTFIFLVMFFRTVNIDSNNDVGVAGCIVVIDLVFGFLVVLNFVFITLAFVKLRRIKKQ